MAGPPEYLRPQDGQAKQACERAAATRWLTKQAVQGAPHGVTCLGAARYSHPPCGALVVPHRFHFLFTCKPDAPPTLYERLAFWQATDGIAQPEQRRRHGRVTEGTLGHYINDVFLRGGDEALAVNGVDIPVVHAKTGAHLSHHSGITPHRLTADNVVAVAQAGRGRGKSATDNHHVLQPQGSHLAHNCGHGQQDLAALLRSRNLRAWLFHTGLAWSDAKAALLRQTLARRATFFHDIPA
jgi:hypothetical protein